MSAPITLSPSEYRRADGIKPLSEWEEVVREEGAKTATLLGPVLMGLATLVIGVGGFFLWASTTPVAQASMAPGKVIVQSNTKTVTHLEGGTLKAITVQEGDKVKEGDLLATLDVTRSQATAMALRQQLFILDIKLARLLAEKDEKNVFTYDKPVPAGMDKDAAAQLISTERKLFQERRSQYSDQLAVDQSSIEQLDSQALALVARRKSWAEQVEFVRHDYEALAKLEKQQLATKAAMNEKKIQLVDMETRITEADAEVAENKQKRSQAELSLANRRTDYFRVLSEAIQQTQGDIGKIRQDIISAEDVVAKADIRSPQDGVVANVKIRTPGSAVVGGQPILDIVPDNQPMLIEGKARAADIDAIHVGQQAEVKLSSFGAAEAKPLIATITYIAADGTLDERSGDMTYLFRAKVNDGELKKQPNLFLYPGMTADVSIINGNRTALAYLALPIMQSFRRAFREQ
jgi:HlyD family secretion protein